MVMSEGLDEGDVLLQQEVAIGREDHGLPRGEGTEGSLTREPAGQQVGDVVAAGQGADFFAQVEAGDLAPDPARPGFRTTGILAVIRHPWYTGTLILLVFMSTMGVTNFAAAEEEQRKIMRELERQVLSEKTTQMITLWWYKINPHRSYVKGWKIAPSHYLNQQLDNVWLDKSLM